MLNWKKVENFKCNNKRNFQKYSKNIEFQTEIERQKTKNFQNDLAIHYFSWLRVVMFAYFCCVVCWIRHAENCVYNLILCWMTVLTFAFAGLNGGTIGLLC